MPHQKDSTKVEILRCQGALHPDPDSVTDPQFQSADFFDPHDLIQVKYEMLRRVRTGEASVSHAADQAGLSRPSFYQAQEGFQRAGLPGLIRQKPGPRRAHKLTETVQDFLRQQHVSRPELSWAQLAQLANNQFHVSLHPRTIERALTGPKKKRN